VGRISALATLERGLLDTGRISINTLGRSMNDAQDLAALLRGRTTRLSEFVEAEPVERASILSFVAEQAGRLPPGARVIDVGAGDAPYRELFEEQAYTTLDRAETPHSGEVDFIGHAEAIPAAAHTFDAVVCTQVLEHVPAPLDALKEFHRVLVPGGVLIATVPFAWEEHEAPYDFYRYTRYGIAELASSAGFTEIEVQPRTDCFTTLAQLLRNSAWAMGSAPDGMDELRQQAREALVEIADAVGSLSVLDVQMILPLGFTLRACSGGAGSRS
jgi:SAM-dependent methyltransferase